MKLTKQQETEIMLVYNAYWDNYIKGDVEAMHPLLDGDYTQVGSAEGEVFFNKKDAVQFLYDTIDQVTGKLQMRNRMVKLEQQGNFILIHELCDLYALSDEEWIFYSKFRASTLMQEKKDGWKISHQHSSFPDTKAEEGQNIAIDKIAEENLQLREAIKRRTVELEHKNRELEIEAALERVRSRTMGMQHSTELAQTALLMFEQIQTFGVDIWSCGFNIWNKEEKICTSWMSSKGVLLPPMQIPLTENVAFIHFYESRLRGDSLFVDNISGEELEKHYRYMRTLPGIKEVMEIFANENLTLPERQINHLANFSHGNLLFRTVEPCPQLHDIFKRFAKVFKQTYTRFLDLQKAEAQAREAQIEAVLERVRSRSLAMKQSIELQEVITVVFEQMQNLGVKADASLINILRYQSKDFYLWIGTGGKTYAQK